MQSVFNILIYKGNKSYDCFGISSHPFAECVQLRKQAVMNAGTYVV